METTEDIDEKALDEALKTHNAGYKYHRDVSKTIQCIRIHKLKDGTFENIMKYLRASGFPPNQLKVPRQERRREIIELLTKIEINE